jgi:hypothetical protein
MEADASEAHAAGHLSGHLPVTWFLSVAPPCRDGNRHVAPRDGDLANATGTRSAMPRVRGAEDVITVVKGPSFLVR